MKTQHLRVLLFATCITATLAAQNRTATGDFQRHDSGDIVAASAAAPQAEPAVSGSWGLDFTSAYYFRGIVQENQGMLGQPHLELTYGLAEQVGPVRNLELRLGTWNSLHDGPSSAGGPGAKTSAWYESDFYLDLSGSLFDKWSASATYLWYSSPNAQFNTAEELLLGVSYDDKALWGEGFGGLQPRAALGFEMKGQADGGGTLGRYLELAVEPEFELGKTGALDWSLSVPVTLGLSAGNYYEHPVTGSNGFLGFFDIGAVASTPLPMIPSRFGPWQMSISLHSLVLGNSTKAMNAGDGVEWIAGLGFSTTF
ncbi:MAG: hypothetical protein KDC98_12685 [Planctomycetes bacterium]|nr:hypothetical protein [Planctomycetota bacterium]